ncbi:hypothetical protein [uncultured Methanobrevibacter sp.]|uniref:hypothetical protein n=1 Tax=uncultured Methanobrevibacter sp. TaxID=253161 RepID=UPI0025D89366|nr:hypothetical protein [uncultured Methanobrevibacter sp.]
MAKKKYIDKKELEEFYTDLHKIIEDVEEENPLKILSFANSLVQYGNKLINDTYIKLVAQGYDKKEFDAFLKTMVNKEE